MPKLNEETKKQVLDLAFPADGQQPLSAAGILEHLSQENARLGEEKYVITTDRSIQKFIGKIKGQETEHLSRTFLIGILTELEEIARQYNLDKPKDIT